MYIKIFLIMAAVLLTVNLLIEGASTKVTTNLANTTEANSNDIFKESNTTRIKRFGNGKFERIFTIKARKQIKKRSPLDINRSRHEMRSHRGLHVRVCPKALVPLKNITKEKLLGVWYAYATTPLTIQHYIRRCNSINVLNNPYFNTNIIYTDYKHLCITYSCLPNEKTGLNDIKLRVLTRTRIPMAKTLRTISTLLVKYKFPINALDWLRTEAFCFEWYQLNFELYPRPGRFQAPWGLDPNSN